MCDEAACDRQSKCSYLLKKLQNFFHHDKIVDGGDSIKQLTQIIGVVSGCDEGQAYLKAVQQHVVQAVIGPLEGSGAHFIFLPPEGDLCYESKALFLLSLLTFQTGDTACLEEIASYLQGYPSNGYLMISVGVMLSQWVRYKPSEKCFLSALSYFEHKQNHLGTVVATVNLAAFHKICGDYQKAQSYCNAAVGFCWDFARTPATDVHLKVVFRLVTLSQKLTDYKSYHDILRVAVKFDIDQIRDTFAVKYMKQLMTLQLKEHEGEQIKHDDLDELALQLFDADTFIQAQPLTVDFIAIVMTLAEMYCSIKCLGEAKQLIDKLELTFLCFYSGNCPLFGFLQYQIGHFKFKYGEASEAESSLQKAEKIFICYFGRDHHMVGSCKSLQGACALQRGNQKEACHYLKEACIIFEKIDHHHPEVGTILLKFADLESEAGIFENAKLTIEEALEMFILSCGKVSLRTALAYLQGASILLRKGKFLRSALDKVKKTTDIFILHGLSHDHPDVAFCRCLQGQLLHSLGQVKEAEEEFLFVHHQLSSQDDLPLKTKVITPELYRMFFLVDTDGLALKGSLCFSSRIDSLPFLGDLELSKLHNQCNSINSAPTTSTVWPLAHVSYFSYRFSSSDKALPVFYNWISRLGRTLELSEVLSISTPKDPLVLQRNCAVHLTFLDPICASLSLAVEEGSVYVKCRAVKESGSTCICSSVKSALESIMESLESDFQGSEQTLCLPCVEDGGENGKEPTESYCHCKDFQDESSCNTGQKLDLHAQTNWEPDVLKIGPSFDLSQTEDTESLSFTAHPEDKIGTDVNNGLHITDGTEEHVHSLLTPVSASSLNSLPLSQYDATNEKPQFMQKALPSLKNVHGETYSGKETGNVSDTSSTSQGIFISSHYHESAAVKANCEEGWIAKYHPSSETKDNLPPNEIPQETCSVQSTEACSNKEELREDHRMEFDQSPGLPLTTENGKGTIPNGNLICELQDEVVFYQDQCHELREELIKLKEKLKLCEEEKQSLQAEVGRQLFLESKERQCSKKVYQPPSKHASGRSKPVGVRGTSHDFSGANVRLKGGAGPLEKAEKLTGPFHNGEKSCRGESCPPQENKQLDEVSESVSGVNDKYAVNGKQYDDMEERKEIFDNTDGDEQDEVCNNSNTNSSNSDSEGAAVTFHAENVNGSIFFGDVDLSQERYDSASSLSQSFDVPYIGLESQERSSPSFTSEQSESERLTEACAANGQRDKEGADDFSFPDGAKTQFYFNHHSNDTVDGAANTPDRAQDSLKQEDFTNVNQDSLPGDVTQRQNVSGTRITAEKDTGTDQSDSHVSNQSKKWEHLGARPRDRPPKTDRYPEPPLLNSLEDLVPQQAAGPVAHGVSNTFLARHSEDKHLHESLYYTNAEKMLTENSSLQGASHVDSMVNLTDSNKAQLYFGECQVPFRPDPYSQTYASLFPQTSGACIGGNNSSNTGFNLLNPNVANNFVPFTGLQDGTFHSGFTGSGLTSDFMQPTGSQICAFNTMNSNLSINDHALGTRGPQIPPEGHFTSFQINPPIHSGFKGAVFTSDLTGSIGPEMTHSATGTHRKSDFRDSASMLPSTRNSELLNPNVANNFVPFTRLQGGTFPSLLRDEVFCSGFTGSVLTSDLMTTGLQTSVMSGADQHFGQLGGSMMNTNSVTELVNSPNNTLHELEQCADEGCALVEIVPREREEREQFGQEIERPECEIGAERAQQRERDERELRVAIREQQCQEAMRRPSLCQEEREIGAEGVQQTTVCVVRSLNANNNSCQALAEDIEAATARIQARWPWFGRWWCTCAGGLHDHNFGAICSNCFKYKYCGPCRVRPQSDQDECCICLEDVSSGCMILPCSHKVHRECAIAMIQNGIRMCPVCRYPLYSPAPE